MPLPSFLIILILALLPSPALAATCPEGQIEGVLVRCYSPDDGFLVYVRKVLAENTSYVIAFATVLIVYSGVQYMAALGNSGKQATAKQRILSIVTGIVFFTLIRFFLALLAPEVQLS